MFFRGFIDSLNYNKLWVVIRDQRSILKLLYYSFMLNLVLPSLIYYYWFNIFYYNMFNDDISYIIFILIYFIFNIPFLFIKSIINLKINAKICKKIMTGNGKIGDILSNLIFEIIIYIFLSIEIYIIRFIPFIGIYIYLIYTALSSSYFSYEYKWSISVIPIENRINFFITRWPYFIGFGTIFVFIDQLFPKPYNSFIYTFYTPFMIIISTFTDLNNLKPYCIHFNIFKISLELTELTPYLFKLIVKIVKKMKNC